MSQNKTVVVLGASSNPDRYFHKALTLLVEKGCRVIPIHPKERQIEGISVKTGLSSISNQ